MNVIKRVYALANIGSVRSTRHSPSGRIREVSLAFQRITDAVRIQQSQLHLLISCCVHSNSKIINGLVHRALFLFVTVIGVASF